MLAVLGRASEAPKRVVVNELSTIASIWISAQFLHGESIHGNKVGLRAAARNVPNLVDLETGRLGAVVQNVVNGSRTTTLATLDTLASLLANCLTAVGCGDFFKLAAPPGEPPAVNTLQAFHDVALNPWHNVDQILSLLPPAIKGDGNNPVFIPTLLWPPTAWTLALVYSEGGFNAPGGMSVDAGGNLWTNNNFIPGSQSFLVDIRGILVPDPLAYSGTGVTKLASNGAPLSPPTGFLGGGTFGAAFGVAIDDRGHVFIGNFGGDSLTELAPDGTPISPDASSAYSADGGYDNGRFNDPQSVIVDSAGNLWVSNIGGNTVSHLVGGDPSNIRTWGRSRRCKNRFTRPWGLASDQQGRIWVTNFGRNSVSVIDPDSARPLCPTATYRLGRPGPRSQPQGLALDMDGSVWVAQTGAGTVTLLETSKGFRRSKTFNADSTSVGPWGIAVDGANNFDNDKVCLEGAAIPPSGEGSTVGEERLQSECGGNGAVVVFGIAAPVAAPLIGPPVQP